MLQRQLRAGPVAREAAQGHVEPIERGARHEADNAAAGLRGNGVEAGEVGVHLELNINGTSC